VISRDRRRPSVVILVADGARPDTLGAALDAGTLPALARLRAEGSFHTVTTVFPSVTGPAYAPFLMGRFPGPVGLPALRWFDRARTATWWPHFTRSYVGSEMRKVDRDLDPAAPTLFETGGTSLAALNVIGRGLPRGAAEGRSLGFTLRAAKTHFSGDVRGWLAIDRDIGATVAERIRVEQPDVTFCALTGIDKTSHAGGHLHPDVTDAMRIVDGTAAWIRDDAERDGRWETMQMMIVSDHGHSPVRQHDDLAALIAVWGYGVRAHPFVIGSGRDVAVMVSGNAMAHVYCDLDRTGRLFWPDVAAKFTALAERLLERPSVDLMLLPTDERRTEIRARGRGYARLVLERGRYAYRPETGDPLGIGHHEDLTADAAWDVTSTSDYPDALVQIAHLAGSARVGEIILSAARDWDLRARYEPIPHVSSHGALHRAHMLVPLITSRPTVRTPRRTVDVMPSALTVLGRRLPATLDGVSFF
jgi:hypothetical protein